MIYYNKGKRDLIKAIESRDKIISKLKKENKELKKRIRGIDSICRVTSKHKKGGCL